MEDTEGEELSTPLLASSGEGNLGNSHGDAHGDGGDAVPFPNSYGNAPHSKTGVRGNTTPGVDYESHFTLRTPASTVHFRGSTLRVIDTDQDQIILQERSGGGDGDGKHQDTVLVKRLSPGTYAQRCLRMGYTLITILFLGFLFVASFQVLLFLFVALPVDSKDRRGTLQSDAWEIVSTLLGIPLMLYSLSSLMAMGSAFVVDTYNGAALFRSTLVEMLYMFVFLIGPILVFAIYLLAGDDEPWIKTADVWASMVAILFCVWSFAVTYNQIQACFWFVERHFNSMEGSLSDDDTVIHGNSDNGQEEDQIEEIPTQWKRLMKIANQAVILTQTARYSGEKRERFNIMEGADVSSNVSSGQDGVSQETFLNLYSRVTALSFFRNKLRIFELIDPPKRIYSSEEARETLPFMTKSNWSMRKMWCSGDIRQHNVVVAQGPSALTNAQIKYSVLCTLASSLLLTLLLIGGLAWFDLGVIPYLVALVICLICCIYPICRSGSNMLRMYQDINSEQLDEEYGTSEDDATRDETTMFQVWQSFRITRPNRWYCYARIAIEVVFLFVWPFINMLVQKNYPVAFLFFVLGGFTILWRYFDPSAVLSEIGSLMDVADDTVTHKQLFRLNEVIGRVSTNKGWRWWFWIFVVFFVAIFILFWSANGGTEYITPLERGPRTPILLVDDFYYPPQEHTLAYPLCQLTKGFEFPGGGNPDLSDYSFLSVMAYENSDVTNYTLAKWFGGSNIVVDEEEFVTQFRKDSGTAASPVFFKLFSLTEYPSYAVMSIRGSETSFDWLSNMQLWSSSGLAQMVKWITPFGWVWGPILPDLIELVNLVQSPKIASRAYYKVTTQFVNDVMAGYGGGRFSNLHVTGVSLGGGLAIITGAQTDAFAIAISGLGATLSRKIFDPPIKLEKLNAQTFNFIPERDIIARIGGRAEFFQNGQCIAPKNDLFGCHNMWRSLCEINYSCGSESRPVPCRCVTQFGYPEPVQTGTRSFEEACQEASATWYDMFSPN